MKSAFAAFLWFFALTNAILAEEPVKIKYTSLVPQPMALPFNMGDYARTQTWQFSQPVCAQMKIVSVGGHMPKTNLDPSVTQELRPWSPQSHQWQKFLVAVHYLNCDNLEPDRFRFVLPSVTLRGFSANFEQPADVELLWLFNKASTAKDIQVEPYPITGTPILGQEYKVLKLSSKQEKLAWDVRVRFHAATGSEH